MSCWQEQEIPLSISPLLSVVRWILGYSLPTEVLQAFLPVSAHNSSYFSNLVSILWESHKLLALIQQEVCKLLLFWRKEERKGRHLRQLCHSLMDQTVQKLTWLSCSCPKAVPSKLLGDILTEEGLTTDSRGTTSYIRVHTIWMPSILVFWGLHWQFRVGSKFPELEVLVVVVVFLCQIMWNLCANKSLQLLPLIVWNKPKTEHLSYREPNVCHMKDSSLGCILQNWKFLSITPWLRSVSVGKKPVHWNEITEINQESTENLWHSFRCFR